MGTFSRIGEHDPLFLFYLFRLFINSLPTKQVPLHMESHINANMTYNSGKTTVHENTIRFSKSAAHKQEANESSALAQTEAPLEQQQKRGGGYPVLKAMIQYARGYSTVWTRSRKSPPMFMANSTLA